MINMHSTTNIKYLLLVWLLIIFGLGAEVSQSNSTEGGKPEQLELLRAAMCERIEDYSPVNRAVVFSVAVGKISCFSSFDPVPEDTQIEHRWYFKDTLSTKKKLFLKTPRWSTFSSIQLREADKGPWRVEIVDKNNRILGILRFSVTD